MTEVKIRTLTSFADFDKVVALQRMVWNHSDLDLTPPRFLHISVQTGAILLGAFVGDVLTGFVYSFPAVVGGIRAQHSLQLAVLPEYRGHKIGKSLKVVQRETALRMGYGLITWTADPLLARNANLNLHTLGAGVKTYLPDFYKGQPTLSIAPGVPADRLLIEWDLHSKEVEMRLKGNFPDRRDGLISYALECVDENIDSFPKEPDLSLISEYIGVRIPGDISRPSADPKTAAGWMKAVRSVLPHYFSKGYRIVDFMFGGKCGYVLKKSRKEEVRHDD